MQLPVDITGAAITEGVAITMAATTGGPYGPTVVVSSGDREHHHGYGYSNDYYDRANNHVNRNDHVNRNVSVNRTVSVDRNAHVSRNAHVQSERKRSSSASGQNRQ